MMKRLTEQEGLDSSDRRLSELLSSAAPFQVDPFRKRRIWVRLERGAKLSPRSGRFWLRPLVIATLLISGTAMAELGQRYVLHGSGFLGLAAPPSASAPNIAPAARLPKPRKLGSSALPDPAHEIAPAAPSAEPAQLAPPVPAAPEPTAAVPNTAAPRAQPKTARSRPEAGEDATPVVEAIQALRTERDPARAQALLNDYLKTNPRGTLSGDALALAIEAASARHDPRAAEYARRYLASYPKGKYRDLAKRALEAQR
ncbi:MAG TPA: hypothetical protein VFK05_14025 [Polyangiaceae bacterium]|nr:hypothetical protein [Polyangiaceae bacterium]